MSPQTEQTTWVGLEPRDALQVRDGRELAVGGSGRTLRPWPSTVAGALGTAFGQDLEAVRGPVPAMYDAISKRWRLHFVLPADIVAEDSGRAVWRRLHPAASRAVTDLDKAGLQLLTAENAGPAAEDGWWDATRLADHLNATPVTPTAAGVTAGPFTLEHRTGIAREDRRVKDAHLYTSEFLRMRETPHERWALAAQCAREPGTPDPVGPVRLGGESRMAEVATLDPSLDWPERPTEFPQGRVLVYLVTPGIWRVRTPEGRWRTTWRLPLPENASIRAAAITGPEPVASASPDGRGGVREAWLRWAVPAGSIYRVQFHGPDPEQAAADWARDHHGRALGAQTTNPDETGRRLATAGFGVLLTGRWP